MDTVSFRVNGIIWNCTMLSRGEYGRAEAIDSRGQTSEIAPRFIVLDANVFIADYWLRSSSFVLFREFLARTHASWIVPRVILQEVINHHQEELEEIKGRIRDTHRKIGRLLRLPLGPISEIRHVIKTSAEEPYDKFLLHELKGMGAQIIDYKDIPHEVVVARDLARIRPFRQSGRGYRDTSMWEVIIRNCIGERAVTVLITNNAADFCDAGGQLHPHLKRDIQEKGMKNASLRLFKDLVHFTDAMIVPFLKARKDFALLVENKKIENLDLEKVCEENIDSLIEAIERSPNVMIGDPDTYEPSVDELSIPSNFQIASASEVSKDRLLVIFEFRATVAFLFFLHRSDYACMSEEEISGIQIVDPEWNESVMQVESTCEIDVRCRLTFDTAKHAVESFEVEGIEGVEGN